MKTMNRNNTIFSDYSYSTGQTIPIVIHLTRGESLGVPTLIIPDNNAGDNSNNNNKTNYTHHRDPTVHPPPVQRTQTTRILFTTF